MKPLHVIALAAVVLCGGLRHASAEAPLLPNPAVEARAASELWKLKTPLRTGTGEGSLYPDLATLATSLARLGRLESALQTAGEMRIKDEDVSNGAPQTRAEVLRLVIRRRCMVGNIEGAKQLIPLVKDHRCRADALLALARANLRRGELEAARQSLSRVSPIASKNIRAMAYTAYLLTRCGERAAAKRLFARATALLPPLRPKGEPSDPSRWGEEFERDYVRRYLLKAGFVDEWLGFKGVEPPFLSTDLLASLSNLGRFDILISLARNGQPESRIGNYAAIAALLFEKTGRRQEALQLLQEAEALYKQLGPEVAPTAEPPTQVRILDSIEFHDAFSAMIAYTHRALGDEVESQKWIEGHGQKSPARIARLQAMVAIYPLLDAWGSRVAPTLAEVELAHKRIVPHLSRLRDGKNNYRILYRLVDAQIKAKQYEAAQVYLPTLESLALDAMRAGKEFEEWGDMVKIAQMWRQTGNELRAQTVLKMLEAKFRSKPKTLGFYAYQLITSGFLKEGKAIFASLLPVSRVPKYYPAAARWEAHFHPDVFPEPMAKITNASVRAYALKEFVQGLTAPIYENREESEIVMSANGLGTVG